ncbi:DNA glycosylase [Vararia minispora EC-137]|uniref:DNA glycosylase n=1 Tax=Vararia minispora EC-137 TaxID=1314806 RepID=A0ACB8Q8L3_9AGAM|nr:DNA glycosylase [Vararia minispora EC-137]
MDRKQLRLHGPDVVSSRPFPLDSDLHTTPSTPPLQTKRQRNIATFHDQTPFPNHASPTQQEASRVHTILVQAHPQYVGRPRAPVEADGNAAATCGKVANVLDALIGTILSQNTSARNSTAAKAGLDAVFGLHDFASIVSAPREAVESAIRPGGLASRKAAAIQGLLRAVHERHGAYSLQHLTELSDADATAELVSYAGVGPKTAACVLAFSLGRDAFAVDTHVFRLSRLLGWVPTAADRVRAQAHLEARLPAALKYDLHVLMVAHGRTCKGCKAVGARGTPCVLKAYLREQRKKRS